MIKNDRLFATVFGSVFMLGFVALWSIWIWLGMNIYENHISDEWLRSYLFVTSIVLTCSVLAIWKYVQLIKLLWFPK